MTEIRIQNGTGDVKAKAFHMCQEFLGAPWTDIDIEQFDFSPVSGGLSNVIYRCALPDNMKVKNAKTPRQVLLRIYGVLQDETNVIVTEAATFTMLAERNLGPKLYGVFSNGRLEEFIPSRTLKTRDYRQMYATIAREMAKIHALAVPVRKVPDFWPESMKKWLKVIDNKAKGNIDLSESYRNEIDWLWKEMKKSKSPIVYCHNDLQGGNILLPQDSSVKDFRLILIDFEFGAYNYRGFDLANQFCEWCYDYNTGEFPYFTTDFDKFPSEEEQRAYIRAYLDQLVLEGEISAAEVDSEVDVILAEIPLFSMASHLLWSLWSTKMSFLSTMDFAHREYGTVRMKAYMVLKQKYTKSALCNGDSK